MRYIKTHFIILFPSILILLLTGITLAQKPAKTPIGNTEYSGKFDAELVPDTRQLSRLEIKRVENPAGYKFARTIGKDVVISAGKIFDLRRPGGNFQIALLEPVKDSPSVCIDLNANAAFGDDECFAMTAATDNPNDFEYTLKLPIKTPLFKTLPIFLRYRRSSSSPEQQSGDPLLMQSLLSYATGRV